MRTENSGADEITNVLEQDESPEKGKSATSGTTGPHGLPALTGRGFLPPRKDSTGMGAGVTSGIRHKDLYADRRHF